MRYRIEIYDDIKSNDLTLYFEEGVNREHLTEIVFSNIKQFSGDVRAFVFDKVKKKKTAAVFLPMDIVNFAKSLGNVPDTSKELQLI
jgi:hypothetical protein